VSGARTSWTAPRLQPVELHEPPRALRRDEAHRPQLAVAELVQVVGQADAVQHLHRGGMDRVAAEVALEVRVQLEHPHAHAAPGQEQAQHHARRPAAHDDAARGGGLRAGALSCHLTCSSADFQQCEPDSTPHDVE